MKYVYSTEVRDNDKLREGFNELTRKTFGFDFVDWFNKGQWGDTFLPHVLADGEKVISNVSVNLMKFNVNGKIKNYIQLGTVMTDPEYQRQGLNEYIMKRILESYKDKVDGFYLFGNDSAKEYYPRFGFEVVNEYEYLYKIYKSAGTVENDDSYVVEKVDFSDIHKKNALYSALSRIDMANMQNNPNEEFAMCNNKGLFQFWLEVEYDDNIYYIEKIQAYVIARKEDTRLIITQIFADKQVNIDKLAKAFGADIDTVVFEYTPVNKEQYEVRLHKREDCTLFIIGEDLKAVESQKMMFQELSHA